MNSSTRVSLPSRLVATQLEVGYGDRRVLNQVDFAVPNGQLTILVGPNGCGKSTLLKSLARILTPSGGVVCLDGQDIHQSRTRDVAKKLALLPQDPVAPEGMTVREVVAQGRFPHQRILQQWSREDERAVEEAMSVAQVNDFAHRSIGELSGGQRQRCWIAMVLAQETDLILLDEPTTFLDLKIQVDVMNLLARLAHEKQRTLVVVLHELNLAAAYADYLVMMRDGAVLHQGTPEEIFSPDNLYQVFGLDAQVIRDPHSDRLICVPTLPDLAVSRSAKLAVV
ncbi:MULTISPECIES: ABC transporter ATP-binding protein [Marinomonas]|uniref:Iron complex transport system ATP-binding protein n=1 Tax=Marinomonas alcarazii TaxID=491949 RepID=A0A318V9I3_9GAMM|nr:MULTISPECIES: ABC transporter ATP-binding protein [Marinomonas]PYF84570.1 iron complex transport system ATP-binding protein [Marinomonas alcarazii]